MLDSAAVAHLVQTVKLAQIAKSWQARAEDAEQQMKASMEKVGAKLTLFIPADTHKKCAACLPFY